MVHAVWLLESDQPLSKYHKVPMIVPSDHYYLQNNSKMGKGRGEQKSKKRTKMGSMHKLEREKKRTSCYDFFAAR